MSDPVSGTSVAAGGLMGASMFGLATGIDYGVVFGAFAGDALGAVLISALIIKVLTFLNSQDLNSLFNMLTRFRGGGSSGK